MSSVTTQNTHPLTAVVLAGENRDPVGHLVKDPIGDREFRFVEIKGASTASQGMAVAGWKLSANSNDFNAVTPNAIATQAARRDFVGIVVATSTAASGMMCYVMTKGKLGTEKNSLYTGALFANCSTNVAAGMRLRMEVGSGTSEYKMISAQIESTAAGMISAYADVIAVALDADSGGLLVRGVIRSSLLHGGGGFGGIV